MKRMMLAIGLALACGCSTTKDDIVSAGDPIVSPTNISTQSGEGEIQIPHYTPIWYEL